MAAIECRPVAGTQLVARRADGGAVVLTDSNDETHFSPTDLLAAALGTCTLTVLLMVAGRNAIDLSAARVAVEPEYEGPPNRRVSKLRTRVRLPAALERAQRERLEAAAKKCTVHTSLPAEMVELRFEYGG